MNHNGPYQPTQEEGELLHNEYNYYENSNEEYYDNQYPELYE